MKPATKASQKQAPAEQPKPSEALVKIENRGALVKDDVPEYVHRESVRRGGEMKPSDIIVNRFQLAHDQTKSAKKQNADHYIKGLEPGMFFNPATKQVYGNEVLILPMLKWDKRARMPEIFTGTGGPLCKSEDGRYGVGDPGGVCRKCNYSLWVDGEPPLCSEILAYHIFPLPTNDHVPSIEDWCLWGAQRTGLRAGRMLNTLWLMRKGAPDLFECVFKLSSFWDTKPKQPCWAPKIDNAGKATRQQYEVAAEIYEAIHNLEMAGRINIEESLKEEDPIDVKADEFRVPGIEG